MYLVGDIGNTEVKICLVSQKFRITQKVILKTQLIKKKYIEKKFFSLGLKKHNIKKALFSSVVPKAYKEISIFLKSKKIFCNELKKLNLKNFLKISPNIVQVGSDRIANAIGMIKKGNNYIIIDFGTATTFDVVNNYKYLGGVIAPGVNLSLKNLIDGASLIPVVNLKKISKVVGKNTESAVRSGFYWGYAGLIDNMIKLIFKETKKKYKIILTGGLSNLFKNSIGYNCILDKDLTIKGLVKVLKKL